MSSQGCCPLFRHCWGWEKESRWLGFASTVSVVPLAWSVPLDMESNSLEGDIFSGNNGNRFHHLLTSQMILTSLLRDCLQSFGKAFVGVWRTKFRKANQAGYGEHDLLRHEVIMHNS